jgi:hypothetical protein
VAVGQTHADGRVAADAADRRRLEAQRRNGDEVAAFL